MVTDIPPPPPPFLLFLLLLDDGIIFPLTVICPEISEDEISKMILESKQSVS